MIQPKGYRILIKQDSAEETSEGGIVLTHDTVALDQRAQITGELVAVGDDVWTSYSQPWAAVGDRVMFAQYVGVTVTDEDTDVEYILCNDEDITAVVAEN